MCCRGGPNNPADAIIERALRKDYIVLKRELKILLLGERGGVEDRGSTPEGKGVPFSPASLLACA